jgi:pimeloyl-ACP methyl ester carboxylesterase
MMLRPWQIKASAEDAAAMIPAAAALMKRYGELSRLPVSIMAGAEDMVVDWERQSARLHRATFASSLQVVSGLGHMVHHGAPHLVAQAIEAITAPRQSASAAMMAPNTAVEEYTTDIG